jgi:hypothetical protein
MSAKLPPPEHSFKARQKLEHWPCFFSPAVFPPPVIDASLLHCKFLLTVLVNTAVGALLLLSCKLPLTALPVMVANLQVATDGVAGARRRRGRTDEHGASIVLELQIASHSAPANLVQGRTGGKALDLKVAIYGRAGANGECAASIELYVLAHLGSDEH